MSSPVSVSHEQLAVRRRPSITQELPAISRELTETLDRDQASIRREVLLWQRWVRYMALGAVMLLSIVLSRDAVARAVVPIVGLAISYVAVVMLSSWMLHRSGSRRLQAALPGLLVAADVAALTGLCYLTSAPEQFNRVLMLGLLSVQLAVFHFGRLHGALTTTLTVGAYLLATFALTPYVAGERPAVLTAAFDTILFVVTSAVLIHTFGGFRERMDALRLYCKVVESGELARVPNIGNERWPDAVTLLGRSFDAMRQRLADQVGTDPLTGCLNRRTLETTLATELRRARRRGTTVSVVAIDIDFFKQVNDVHGHAVGDLLLQQLAAIMKTTARDTDAVARAGGDEFVVILPDTTLDGALIFAERLRGRVDEAGFGQPESPIATSVSVGIASADGAGTEPATLMRAADKALYRAKAAGRNQVLT